MTLMHPTAARIVINSHNNKINVPSTVCVTCFHCPCSQLHPYSLNSILHCCFSFLFKINFFKKKKSEIPSACQTIWIQFRPDVLILFQTVCKVISRRQQKLIVFFLFKWVTIHIDTMNMDLSILCFRVHMSKFMNLN